MLKRIFDIIASNLGLILSSPVLILIAFLIKIKRPGYVLFRQTRAGRHGTLFTIYKFRIMQVDHQRSTISVKGEIRMTRIGAMLRKHKLDELPELWNVLIGDMSFVGPRPDMPEYANKLVGEDRNILELRPGLTGPATLKYAKEEELLASVSDPNKFNDEVIWPDKVRINMDYYRNKSFFRDISIIYKTLFSRNRNEKY